jgi:hypothetical protein
MICGKIIFQTKEEAGMTLIRMNEQKRKNKSNRQPHKVYYCDDCDGFHLSSKRKKEFGKSHTIETHVTNEMRKKQVKKSGSKILKIKNYTGTTS